MNILCAVNLGAFCLLLTFSCATMEAMRRDKKLKKRILLFSFINITILSKYFGFIPLVRIIFFLNPFVNYSKNGKLFLRAFPMCTYLLTGLVYELIVGENLLIALY